MRLAAVSVLAFLLASAAAAQLTPGAVVRSGEPFPIVADFNGDGLDDLVQERNVILSDGVSLVRQHDLGLPAAERVVGVLDLNGDHLLDLLTEETPSSAAPPSVDPGAAHGSYRYRVYIADAQRRYSQGIEVPAPLPYIADADGDGKDDLIRLVDVRPDGIRTTATEVTVLRSLGDGTFERLTPFRIAFGFQIYPDPRVLSGDLDHDGLPDLVIRCTNDLVVLRGTGGGRFAVEDRYLPMRMEFGWWSTRLADIDGDSNLDVIIPMFRGMRVFFGDGRGNFPRTATGTIAKRHDVIGLPDGLEELLHPDRLNQPRDLAVGHFTRSDRMQIAAGTSEGDLVVFEYELGRLKEVARTPTEFWALDIRPISFRAAGGTDLYVMGTLIWGSVYPRPRIFEGTVEAASAGQSARSTRSRAVRPGAPEIALRAQVQGDCIDAAPQLWKFERDGVFGVARRDDTTVQAVFDGSVIYYRLAAPYAKEAVEGSLTETDGTYSGTATVLTSCGWKQMTISAKPE